MPRKPTQAANLARAGLLELLTHAPQDAPVPTMRELGEMFDVHPSTMFRMLRDLAAEGAVWQSPGGRFFPVKARAETLKGAPICFIGRELWQWSQLYQELLEGVSQVCAANGSPLVQLSAPSLVRQTGPTQAPQFAPVPLQVQEMRALLNAVPRGCGGFVLDHLWCEEALSLPGFTGGERVQLLAGTGTAAQVAALDHPAAARLVRKHLEGARWDSVLLVRPFAGDPAIDAAIVALREALLPLDLLELPFEAAAEKMESLLAAGKNERVCLICPEDNVARYLRGVAQQVPLAAERLEILSTQGTGLVTGSGPHLRYDFRRLGKDAASAILQGKRMVPLRPKWG